MRSGLALVISLALLSVPSTASAWSPLRSENAATKKGNKQMAKGEYAAALESYDEAATELPDSKGVQLNRGLALLGQDAMEPAKEAFLAAADPSAPKDTRADAYYDLGVAFAREGDRSADHEEHEQAVASYREAVDAFKRALRIRPGDRDAAWNLEYALQRIHEQQEEQQQQQDQQQDEQDQQDPQEGDDEQQDDPQDQEQDQGGENEEQQEEEQQDQQGQGDQNQEQQEQSQDQGEDSEQDQEQQGEQGQARNEAEREERLERDEVQRFLDALEQNERSLPLERARRQSAGRRPPEKDW